MFDRRRLLVGSFATVLAARASAAPQLQETADIDQLGKFELILGRPGIVIGVPHGTSDTGTLEIGRILRERLGAGGVFVTGFWDAKTKQAGQREPSHRTTHREGLGGPSAMAKRSRGGRERALHRLGEGDGPGAAQGLLRDPLESPTALCRLDRGLDARPLRGDAEDSRPPSRRRVTALPRTFHASPSTCPRWTRSRIPTMASLRLFRSCPSGDARSSSPGHVVANRAWRLAYSACLADAIKEAQWG